MKAAGILVNSVPGICPFLADVGLASLSSPWALGVTLAFALLAYLLRGVTVSGALAGAALAFVLLYFGGPRVFAVLVALFVITSISTRIGYARKQSLGIAESRRGRNAGQVMANLSVAAISVLAPHICLLLADVGAWVAHPSPGKPVLSGSEGARVGVLACIAALAEAAADTVSSECGEAWSERAYLVTGFRPAPPGTNGAISVPGTFAGAAAAALIAAAAVAARLLTIPHAAVAFVAGFAGSIFDSLLGATLERQGLLGNNAVNFISTLAAAMLAAACAWLVP